MTVIAVASAKGRGVTTAAELLVLLRPTGRRCLLVDADPAGGDWLVRPGVACDPGLVTLAMAGRRRLADDEALRHVQVLGGSLEVVVGPAAAGQATSALDLLAPDLVTHLRSLADESDGGWSTPVDAVVDCGRLSPGSPALPAARQADLTVLVSAATAPGLVHIAPWVELLRAEGATPAVLLHGGGPRSAIYDPAEVAANLGVNVVGTMADDRPASDKLFQAPGDLAALRRTRLVRSMTAVAARTWDLAASAGPAPATAQTPAYATSEPAAPVGWEEHGRG